MDVTHLSPPTDRTVVADHPTAGDLVIHPIAIGTVRALPNHGTTSPLHLTPITSIDGETHQKLHRCRVMFDFVPFPPDSAPNATGVAT